MLKLLSHPTVHIPTNWPSPASSDSDDLDLYSSDDFRMYDFKVRRCPRCRAHDWTDCPFSHPGEKARRRNPLRHHYSGNPCPDFKKGTCTRGDTCEFAHGVFEVWLHPARYRTQPCKDGTACRRRVCFFAHTVEQLRAGSPAARVPVSPPVSPEALMVRMMRAMKFEEEEEEGFEGIDVGWVSELVK